MTAIDRMIWPVLFPHRLLLVVHYNKPFTGGGCDDQSVVSLGDWVAVALGVVAALTPIWVTTNAAAASSLIVLGVLTAVIALWSLGQPGAIASEWITLVVGALQVCSYQGGPRMPRHRGPPLSCRQLPGP